MQFFSRSVTQHVQLSATPTVDASLVGARPKAETKLALQSQNNLQHATSHRPRRCIPNTRSNARNPTGQSLGHMSSGLLFEKVLGRNASADPCFARCPRGAQLPACLPRPALLCPGSPPDSHSTSNRPLNGQESLEPDNFLHTTCQRQIRLFKMARALAIRSCGQPVPD